MYSKCSNKQQSNRVVNQIRFAGDCSYRKLFDLKDESSGDHVADAVLPFGENQWVVAPRAR